MHVFFKIVAVLGLFAVVASGAADAETAFARVDVDANERPRALQMAIVSYAPAAAEIRFTVDLISAIHIADASYYAGLNDRFAFYDELLYELIAPRDTIVEQDARKTGFVSGAQQLLTRILDLSFQLDEIDYAQTNFVHADLSQRELLASMAERDESLYTYFWRVFFAAIREQAADPLSMRDWQILGSVVLSQDDASLKTMLAYEITNTKSIEQVFGNDADSAVIGARNERAIEVLRDRLDAGATRLGIFYGVGHMPDLEQRLLAMGLVRRKTTWVDAWDLTAKSDNASPQ